MRRFAGLTPICALFIDVLDLLAQAQMAQSHLLKP
jgi:hypothetical protein